MDKIIQIIPLCRKIDAVFIVKNEIQRTPVHYLALLEDEGGYRRVEMGEVSSDGTTYEDICGVGNYLGIEYDGIESDWSKEKNDT